MGQSNNVLQFPGEIVLGKMIRDGLWKVTADWREAKRRGLKGQAMMDFFEEQNRKRAARKARTKQREAKDRSQP